MENGTIADVGPAYSPNFEKIVAAKPDVVFVYFYPGPYGTEAVISKLRELKIPYVVINEFQEDTPLGRAEWVKFLAVFSTRPKTQLSSSTQSRLGGTRLRRLRQI